jgi:cytochrome bd-type quinol oxidase subunit 2
MHQYVRPFPQTMPNTCVVTIQNAHYTQHFPRMCPTHLSVHISNATSNVNNVSVTSMWEVLSPIIISTPIYTIKYKYNRQEPQQFT